MYIDCLKISNDALGREFQSYNSDDVLLLVGLCLSHSLHVLLLAVLSPCLGSN